MKIEQLLEKLKEQKKNLEFSISLLESALADNSHSVKRKAIVRAVKKEKKKKYVHWMQDPKNRAKMMKNIRKMQQVNKERRVIQ